MDVCQGLITPQLAASAVLPEQQLWYIREACGKPFLDSNRVPIKEILFL